MEIDENIEFYTKLKTTNLYTKKEAQRFREASLVVPSYQDMLTINQAIYEAATRGRYCAHVELGYTPNKNGSRRYYEMVKNEIKKQGMDVTLTYDEYNVAIFDIEW